MRKIISLAITLVFTYIVNAQEIQINGLVVSTNNEVLVNVAISVYNANTDQLITYNYSDIDGNYHLTFKEVPFYLKASILGFKDYTSEKIALPTANQTIPIRMEEDATELDEVVILQKKKAIVLRGDKMIVAIASSGLGDGNSGIETLSKLPGIRLDKDENILFRGDGNLQILIDGKPSLLSGDALKQYLKTIDGTNIKSIEIIANPSAKYAASGTGGILNIKLKKAVITGLTGNVYSSIGYGEFIKNRNGINLYNNTEKWNLNAGLYYSYNESVNHRKVIQTIKEANNTNVLEQLNDWFPTGKSLTAKFGLAYKITKNASMGTSMNYNNYVSDEKTIGRTNEFNNNNNTKYTLLNSKLNGKSNSLKGNVYYTFASDSLDTKLDIQLNYAHFDNNELKTTNNQYLNTADNLPYTNEITVQNSNPTLHTILSSKIDFEKKINTTISFETGLKYSYVTNDFDMILKNKDAQGNFILDRQYSNHLIYKESIFAFYGITNYNTDKWSIQAGLRTEYIDYDATSKTNNQSNTGHNLSFFPSFSVNRSFENNQYRFSYSRRIQRPRYLDLNPFYQYIDTYNVEVGNPNLKPQFTDAFDLTWVHKNNTSISLYSKFSNDEVDNIFIYDETTRITTLSKDNIAKSVYVGLTVNTNIDITKWWDVQCSLDFYFNHKKSEILNYAYDKKGSSWNVSFNQTIKLKNDWKITWNSYYDDGGIFGNIASQPSYDMTFGIKKYFFNKKLYVNLKATDFLKQNKFHGIITQGIVENDWTNRWETRKFNLSLTYNFGHGKKKNVKRIDLNDEQRRL